MSSEIHVVATIQAKPGKLDEVVKLFDETATQVKANEPGTLQYYAVRPKKGDEVHIVERYKDAQALNTHGSAPYFKKFMEALKPLVASQPKMGIGRHVAGYQTHSESKL